MTAAGQFVFGYGSLAAGFAGRRARLRGHRRIWGVAMDNAVAIPGYKVYRRRDDGTRPAVAVAFLDIAEDPAATVDGLLITADDVALRALDERERNYDRVDVTAAVPEAPGTVWAYRGSGAGRARLRDGLRRGRAVVAADYVAGVRAGFDARGIDAGVDLEALPLMDLERVDLADP